MRDLVKFDLPGGGRLYAEMARDAVSGVDRTGEQDMGLGQGFRRIIEAGEVLADSLNDFAPAAAAMLDQLRKLSPHEITVEFGLSLSAEVGIVVASSKGIGHLQVRLHWDASDDAPK